MHWVFRRNAHYALREMLVATNNPSKHIEYLYVANCRHCTFLMDVLQIINEKYNGYSTYHNRIGYLMYDRIFFHTAFVFRMSVSCSEAVAFVPTFHRFRILYLRDDAGLEQAAVQAPPGRRRRRRTRWRKKHNNNSSKQHSLNPTSLP